MSIAVTMLVNFPNYSRGSYLIKEDENGTEPEKLALAKKNIKRIAIEDGIDILLESKLRGSRWLLIWWPANEPRHLETDEIIRGVNDGEDSTQGA